MNQVASWDKVTYQQHVDGANARESCPDGGRRMVELGRVIPSHALQNVFSRNTVKCITVLTISSRKYI